MFGVGYDESWLQLTLVRATSKQALDGIINDGKSYGFGIFWMMIVETVMDDT